MACSAHYLRGGREEGGGGWLRFEGEGVVSELYWTISSGLAGSVVPTNTEDFLALRSLYKLMVHYVSVILIVSRFGLAVRR